VLAVALLSAARGRIALAALNLPSPLTYVYEVDSSDGREVVNRRLDDSGFAAAARTDAAAAWLARSLVARAPHGAGRESRIAQALT
jgi:hypothetical protein